MVALSANDGTQGYGEESVAVINKSAFPYSFNEPLCTL